MEQLASFFQGLPFDINALAERAWTGLVHLGSAEIHIRSIAHYSIHRDLERRSPTGQLRDKDVYLIEACVTGCETGKFHRSCRTTDGSGHAAGGGR
jgi:hypothetical protein